MRTIFQNAHILTSVDNVHIHLSDKYIKAKKIVNSHIPWDNYERNKQSRIFYSRKLTAYYIAYISFERKKKK